jgi:hypothetical protein
MCHEFNSTITITFLSIQKKNFCSKHPPRGGYRTKRNSSHHLKRWETSCAGLLKEQGNTTSFDIEKVISNYYQNNPVPFVFSDPSLSISDVFPEIAEEQNKSLSLSINDFKEK